ncbi:MAG: hypothetical protein KGO96_01730 [Elusimicrobia bacterium]|nr:hypothetical protein [Elusimicrobiota bacterium]MDE2424615.1 hypothetical protein [Elusimicrobiota bacterium]
MEAPPRRSSAGWLALAFLAVVGSAAGGLWYQAMMRQRSAGERPQEQGFDLSKVAARPRPRPASQAQAGPAPAPASGLAMLVRPAGPRPEAPAAKPAPSRPASFTALLRRTESAVGALARAYTRDSPVIRAYGRDWMSYPDLRKLNDDYMRDHDPAAFLRGLAASPNFPKLVRKYASQPILRQFVLDGLKVAPAGALAAASQLLGRDGAAFKLVENVASGLGLPPGLLAQAGAGPPAGN